MISRYKQWKYKKFCADYTKIENYEKMVKDNETQIWDLHHRLETHFSDGTERPKNAQITKAELIALDMYFNRPPEEFIFLTRKEHTQLHYKDKPRSEESKRKMSEARKGKGLGREPWNKGKKGAYKHSKEILEKISKSHIGHESGMKGKQHSEETRKRISESLRGKKRKPFSEEWKRKISESLKKRHSKAEI